MRFYLPRHHISDHQCDNVKKGLFHDVSGRPVQGNLSVWKVYFDWTGISHMDACLASCRDQDSLFRTYHTWSTIPPVIVEDSSLYVEDLFTHENVIWNPQPKSGIYLFKFSMALSIFSCFPTCLSHISRSILQALICSFEQSIRKIFSVCV